RTKMVPPPPHDSCDILDLLPRCFRRQTESIALGDQVVYARRPAVSSDGHREVPMLQADHGSRDQVICRRKSPSAGSTQHRVVAGMVVIVGDGCVKNYAAE